MKHPHLFAPHDDEAEDRPHLPFYRSWRGVYATVLVCFMIYVIALAVFTCVFS